MNELEIIFENIKVSSLNKLIFTELNLDKNKVQSSHFYNGINEKDIKFEDIVNLNQHSDKPGTGNILLREIEIGEVITNVMIIVSIDELLGDVVINFKEKEISFEQHISDRQKYITKIIRHL